MQELRDELYAIVAEDQPMTVRQTFYRAVSAGIIDKREADYKNVVCRLLGEMRLDGSLPWGWIADNTRWMRKPRTFSSLEQALRDTARLYRRSVWDDQEVYVEVWCEKDALAGVLYDETARWDVPLMVTRGYPSLSYLYEAAGAIADQYRPAYLYYFGDHDPSGLDIERNLGERLREFVGDGAAEIHLERAAVTPAQIEAWGLPTRPTKKTDSRARGFEGGSIEVDAIPPRVLRQLVRACIERHVDRNALATLQAAEESERLTLDYIARSCAA
jgi:hypothetical protein